MIPCRQRFSSKNFQNVTDWRIVLSEIVKNRNIPFDPWLSPIYLDRDPFPWNNEAGFKYRMYETLRGGHVLTFMKMMKKAKETEDLTVKVIANSLDVHCFLLLTNGFFQSEDSKSPRARRVFNKIANAFIGRHKIKSMENYEVNPYCKWLVSENESYDYSAEDTYDYFTDYTTKELYAMKNLALACLRAFGIGI
jgi:hypothetical protein